MSVSSDQTVRMRDLETPVEDGFQPCYVLQLRDAFSENVDSTTATGYRSDDPLEVVEGRYHLSLILENDYPPYNRRRLHVRAMPKAPQSPNLIPLFHEDHPHNLALIFKSDDTLEKEETRLWRATDDSTLSLGEHVLRWGTIKIMIIGFLHMEFIDQMDLDNDDSYLIQPINVNLEFWVRVVPVKTSDLVAAQNRRGELVPNASSVA